MFEAFKKTKKNFIEKQIANCFASTAQVVEFVLSEVEF